MIWEHPPNNQTVLTFNRKKNTLYTQWKSFLWSYINHLGQNTSCHLLTAFICMDPEHIPQNNMQMLNGPHTHTKKHLMLHISDAASAPDVFSVKKMFIVTAHYWVYFIVPGSPGPTSRRWWWRPAGWQQGREWLWPRTRTRPVRLWWTSWRFETFLCVLARPWQLD